MLVRHCTLAVLLALALRALAAPAAAQQTPVAAAATPATGYTIFSRGLPLGRENVTVVTDAAGTTVTSEGRLSAPLNVSLRRAEFKYRQDWSPESFVLDATTAGGDIALRTSFGGGTASTQGTFAGKPITASHPVTPQTIVHANGVFGSYVALARRLTNVPVGEELKIYVVPDVEISAKVAVVRAERMQIGTAFLDVRRYELTFVNPGGELVVNLTADGNGSLIRVNIPLQGIDMVREDVAASTSRTQIFTNPGDEAVTIPATGFNLGATLTKPAAAAGATTRLPTVILLGGSGANDRDGGALAVPTMAHLAGALGAAGFLAVRYDKRGFGQSGGRAESATMSDYADDVRAVVRWLVSRKDVDPKRIAILGHGEGAWIGMLAASREKRIAALVSVAGPGSTGAELNLEQQQAELNRMNLPAAEREARVAMQKQIQSAALTGRGWEGVPRELRQQADTPWFQSFVAFDPAKGIKDVRQPILFVHGALDRQIPVEHVERLSDLARKVSDSKSVEVVVVRGVNHLLVPATTGEVSEYQTLTDKTVSEDVTSAVTGWLTKTFAAIR